VKILTVVGARPQFIKAALLSRELRAAEGVREVLVHTGQHYDYKMSDVFFEQLGMADPEYSLSVGSGPHGEQTAEMMRRLEPVVLAEAPDWVLVYGDTNSTLAGALVAAKLPPVRLAHVEAGLRSFDRSMPEEVNRLVADRLAQLNLAPHAGAAEQLAREGITAGVEVVGDLMVDLVKQTAAALPLRPAVLDRFELTPKQYAVTTIHRAANTGGEATFAALVAGLRRLPFPVIFPVHPRTRARVEALGVGGGRDNIRVCEPLSYGEMIALQRHARAVLTDSGGMQKEAYVLGVPCVTLRPHTEWSETLEDGWNVLAGCDPEIIERAALRSAPAAAPAERYGSGDTARRIVSALLRYAPPEAAATAVPV
jgi:UDP-N-acetylglucosamine 2-epimerase